MEAEIMPQYPGITAKEIETFVNHLHDSTSVWRTVLIALIHLFGAILIIFPGVAVGSW